MYLNVIECYKATRTENVGLRAAVEIMPRTSMSSW